jgi:flagellar motor switch protein FliN/FliY
MKRAMTAACRSPPIQAHEGADCRIEWRGGGAERSEAAIEAALDALMARVFLRRRRSGKDRSHGRTDNVDLPDLSHDRRPRATALLNNDGQARPKPKRIPRRSGSGVRRAGHGVRRAGQKSRWKSASCSSWASGTIVELDRKVGEAIDIYVNDRLVARGEVVLVEDRLGVTMTEIIKAGQSPARRRS